MAEVARILDNLCNMHFLRLDQLPPGVLFKWLLMAFLSGTINAGGFMACERFVTHVTGFATLFGVNVAQQRWLNAFGMLSVPAYFLLGCMVAAFFTDVAVLKGRKPRYGLVMAMSSALLVTVALMGHYGHFGTYGATFIFKRDYFLLVFLSTASGLHNAAISVASRGALRATHLTGLTTDVGVSLVRAAFGHDNRQSKLRELRYNGIRLAVVVAFALGGVVGAVSFLSVDYLSFLIPAAMSLYCGNLGSRTQKANNA